MLPLVFLAAASSPVVHASNESLPYWSAQQPDESKPAAGYNPLPGVSHSIVFDGNEKSWGSYNHGPIITWHPDTNYVAHWYNGYHGESVENRCVFATSDDGVVWSEPAVSFNTTGPIGLESEYFVNVGGRLYLAAASWDVNVRTGGGAEHSGPDALLMRRQKGKGDESSGDLGPVFWLADSVPAGYEKFGYPTYLEMDDATRLDMKRYLSLLINTSPQETNGYDNGKPNERSFYTLPAHADGAGGDTYVLLARSGESVNKVPAALLGSLCSLSLNGTTPPKANIPRAPPAYRQCRPGTGVFSYALSEADAEALALPVEVSDADPTPAPHTRLCNWTSPNFITIPDSQTRTCVSNLPNGQFYMLGSQVHKGRNPLTLSLSTDGLDWDKVWSVRAGPSTPNGTKNNAYAYPGGLWRGDEFIAIYSIDKVQVAVSRFNLTELGLL